MALFRSQDGERTRLADELAGLRADIKALSTERDNTAQVKKLKDDIERLKLEKDRLTEDNARKIRETEHKVGLLKTKQDHEVANAKRETELAVREENLKADKERFKAEMDFQREHLQREVDRIEGILGKVLKRLPNIEAAFSASVGAGSSRDGD
jgi:chromosome segregation ATPase